MPSKDSSKKSSRHNHRSTLSLQKTEIVINVYDLLPPGRLASILWTIGSSLLHSAVVINGREYAYGGHDRSNMTGVYWTRPRTEPPGGTFKCEILHGLTFSPVNEIDAIIKEASDAFQGTFYNLLTQNCNHFTSYLCEKLTGRPGPAWLNRAASIGVALPCVVPKEWIAPPDFDTANGELGDEDEEFHTSTNENSRMLSQAEVNYHRHSLDSTSRSGSFTQDTELSGGEESRRVSKWKGKAPVRDTSGRVVPPSERAPTR